MKATAHPLEFRPLRRPDLPAFFPVLRQGIGQFERATGLDESADSTFEMLGRWWVWLLFRLSGWVGRPFARIVVGVDGKQVVGTGTLLTLRSTGYVAGMVTVPEFRGRGVASHILGLLQAETVRAHRDWLALDVESENEPAIRVYRKAGYRAVARFTWYRRTGLPPVSAPRSPEMAAASSAELEEVARRWDEARSPDFRAALPSSPRMLSHNEILVRGMRVRSKTWVRPSSAGSLSAVRAFYVRRTGMGVYFPFPGMPEPSPEEIVPLFDPATEWLRASAPKTCLAAVPEPVGASGAALERMGFTAVASTTTMVRPSVA